MERRHRKIIGKHWENFLGDTINTVYRGREFDLALSDNLDKPPYNQFVPRSLDSDVSRAKNLCSKDSLPVLHGEREFIEKYREKHFPGTELEREDRWMRFTGEIPQKNSFQDLKFKWINRKDEDDFLRVLQQVFEAPDSYIELHRNTEKTYGKEMFRFVAYRDRNPVSIGGLHLNDGDAFIYSLATLEKEQGKGLATEILRKLIIKAGEFKVDNIYLQAEAKEWLVDFYRDRGFEVDFTVVCYRGGEWDEILQEN